MKKKNCPTLNGVIPSNDYLECLMLEVVRAEGVAAVKNGCGKLCLES